MCREQAARTIANSIQIRASVICSVVTAPSENMSRMPVTTVSPLLSLTKAPPRAPLRKVISPAISSERSASRSVFRDTPNCTASSRSGGKRSPARRRPCSNSSRICPAISSKARATCTGRNPAFCRAIGWAFPPDAGEPVRLRPGVRITTATSDGRLQQSGAVAQFSRGCPTSGFRLPNLIPAYHRPVLE